MAGPLEQFFPWLDATKARALLALRDSAAKAPDEISRLFHHPVDTGMEALRGMFRGEAGAADAIISSVPGAPPTEPIQGAVEDRLGKGQGLAESITNVTGGSPIMSPIMASLGGWRFAKNMAKAGDSSYLDRMLEAKRLRERGAKPPEVWDKTKVEVQAEGAQKFWLPGLEDAKIDLSGVTGKMVGAGKLLDYPLLYKGMPELENMGTVAQLGQSKGGSFWSFNYPENAQKKVRVYTSGEDLDELLRTTKHEIAGHAVQSLEKHTEGANYEDVKDLIAKMIKGHAYTTPQGAKDVYKILDSDKLYGRNLGEVNARLGERPDIPDKYLQRPSEVADTKPEHVWTNDDWFDSTLRSLVHSILRARLKGEKLPPIDANTFPIVDMPGLYP